MSEIFDAWLVADDTVLAVAYPDDVDLELACEYVQENLENCGVAFVDSDFTVGNSGVAQDFSNAIENYNSAREELECYESLRPKYDDEAWGGLDNDIREFERAVESLQRYACWQGYTDGRYVAFNFIVHLDMYRARTGNSFITRKNARKKLNAELVELARIHTGDFYRVRWCSVDSMPEDWRDDVAGAFNQALCDDEQMNYTGYIHNPIEFLNEQVGADFGKHAKVEKLI